MIIKQIITTTLFLGGTLTARAENLTLQITKGVTVSSAANYRILVEDFAENQNKYCQDWPEIAFKKKAYLAEACTLKDLKSTIRDLMALKIPKNQASKYLKS